MNYKINIKQKQNISKKYKKNIKKINKIIQNRLQFCSFNQ